MFNIGPLELIVVFIVALVVIGPKKLPEIARALGKAIGEFKRATSELQSNFDVDLKPPKHPFPHQKKSSDSEKKPREERDGSVKESEGDIEQAEKDDKSEVESPENNKTEEKTSP